MSFRSSPKLLVTIVVFAFLLLAVGAVASYYKPPDAPAPSRAELEQAARAEVARHVGFRRRLNNFRRTWTVTVRQIVRIMIEQRVLLITR